MRRARDFRLVFCLDIHDCTMEYAFEVLECILEGEVLDYLPYKPLIISERRTPCTRFVNTGWCRGSYILGNAL